MKTLLISEVFPPKVGGSGRWFWEVYSRLPRDQYAIAAGEDARQEEFDLTHDLDVTRLPLRLPSWGIASWRGFLGYWKAIRRIKRIIKTKNISALHCGCVLPEGVMARWLYATRRIPYVCYVHGEELNIAGGSRELRWLTRRVLKKARFLIVNSRNTGRILQEDWQVSKDKLRILHPGVDTQRFVPAKKDTRLRRRLGWDDRQVILTVGRLQKRKGHDKMIEALAAIRNTLPDVLYAIAGDGEERGALQEIVKREKLEAHVQFLGEIDDRELVECYQQCDLFVLPNRQEGKDIEGFGMVLLEAQSCGKPVLAGDSGGTAETMRIPETGWVVDCTDCSVLAEAVVEILADPKKLREMGSAARTWVTEQFDWESLTRQAEQLFGDNRPIDSSVALEAMHT